MSSKWISKIYQLARKANDIRHFLSFHPVRWAKRLGAKRLAKKPIGKNIIRKLFSILPGDWVK